MGVASRCGEQEVGVATGCGCKEVYRFTHTTYPYSSCVCSFLQQHPYFLIKKKCFLYIYIHVYLLERKRNWLHRIVTDT